MRKNTKITIDLMREMLKKAKPLEWFKKGKTITVNDKMQKNYTYELAENPGKNFDPEFKPYLTPKKMLELGVFGGKYCNDCILEFPREWFKTALEKGKLSPERSNPEINYFKIESRMTLGEWKRRGWIFKEDPRGFFQWFMRYYLGRRIPEIDKQQIKRWKSYIRHEAQVEKHAKGRLNERQKQRQSLLQWSRTYDI